MKEKAVNCKRKTDRLKPVVFQHNRLKILDQTKLPHRICYRNLENYQAVVKAIKTLQVRGAPLIGVTAGFGLAVEAIRQKSRKNLKAYLTKVAEILKQTRPTAVNLAWAIDRCLSTIWVKQAKIPEVIINEAKKIYEEEEKASWAIGEIGANLVKKNSKIMTICNAGKLAAPGLGTALAIIYIAQSQGKNPQVYVCETRPLFQGARLTAFELNQAGIPTILITDNMIGTVAEEIDLFLVGADRIAANGDTANKIGTLTLAIVAKYFQKPFYVAAPFSTFDLTKPNGKAIPIELRDEKEVTTIQGRLIAPAGVKAYNPAFDITPGELITGFITEKGIIYPPFAKNIASV